MTTEELLVEKWRSLPTEKQQQVLELVKSLSAETVTNNLYVDSEPISELGKKLRDIRAKIVASGEPLLTMAEIDREVAER
jgi:hypothetical protein